MKKTGNVFSLIVHNFVLYFIFMIRKIKNPKIFIGILAISALFVAPNAFAAEIYLSADKTDLNTDDITSLRLSVDGQIDGGKIELSGLENFDIVGRSSSQRMSIINGNKSVIQEQVLNLQPKKFGKITVQATAKADSVIIKSKSLIFTIKKSLTQSTKDVLLNSSNNSAQTTMQTGVTPTPQSQQDKEKAKQLLTASQANEDENAVMITPDKKLLKQGGTDTTLQAPLPAVQRISAFNFMFYLEFLSILLLLLLMAFGVYILKREKE